LLPSTECGSALLAKYAVIRIRSSNISHSTKLTIHLSYGWILDVINKKPAAQKSNASYNKTRHVRDNLWNIEKEYD